MASDATVRPEAWVLPNRTGFSAWTTQTFPAKAYAAAEASGAPGAAGTSAAAAGFHLFPHQRLIQDLYQVSGPYRGVLLYHGLGSGKSCSSLAAAQSFLTAGRKVVVMLPASLETNYKIEIGRCSSLGNPQLKLWAQIRVPKTPSSKIYAELTDILAKAHNITPKFVAASARKSDHLMWIPAATPGLPAKFVVRTGVAWDDLAEAEHERVQVLISHIIDRKVTFVHYNGLTAKLLDDMGTKPFNDAFIVCDEAHNFVSRVVGGSRLAQRLYKMLMEAESARLVFLTGTPIINSPHETATLLNLMRGPMRVEHFSLLKAGAAKREAEARKAGRAGRGAVAAAAPDVEIPEPDAVWDALRAAGVSDYVDTVSVYADKSDIAITLFPVGFARAAGAPGVAIRNVGDWPDGADATAMFRRVGAALKAAKIRVAPTTTTTVSYALPTSREAFAEFFLDETTDPENPRVKNRDLYIRRALGLTSYLRTVSEAYLPVELPRVRREVPLSEYQFTVYLKLRGMERPLEEARARRAARGGPGAGGGLLSGGGGISVYKAFSRMASNFAFPPSIKRPFPMDIRKQIVAAEAAVGEEESALVAAADAAAEEAAVAPSTSGAPGAAETSAAAATKRAALVKKRYDTELTAAMNSLREKAGEILAPTKKALGTYSAKFYQMLTDVTESPGSVLVYSQFRTVEGLGIFGLALDAAGFAQLRVSKSASAPGGWEIDDAERVLDPRYDGRRYAIFTEDRERTQIVLRIFNSQWDVVPSGVAEQLRAASQRTRSPGANLYGDVCRVFMISQSATEGITTLNVRRVLLTEPYWNSLRIQQVIGRAIRAYSHQALPPANRNVQVFQYEATFTPAQLRSDFTLREKDASMTSDQYIRDVASRKDAVIGAFLDMLKVSAVDCVLRAPENKLTAPSQGGLHCYSFPYPLDEPDSSAVAFVPSLQEDAETPPIRRWAPENTVQSKRVRGRVAVLPDGRKVVTVSGRTGKLYDYDAYLHAGVLVPVVL